MNIDIQQWDKIASILRTPLIRAEGKGFSVSWILINEPAHADTSTPPEKNA